MIYQDLKNNSCPSAALAHCTSIIGVNSSLITRPIVCYLRPEARSNNFYDPKCDGKWPNYLWAGRNV